MREQRGLRGAAAEVAAWPRQVRATTVVAATMGATTPLRLLSARHCALTSQALSHLFLTGEVGTMDTHFTAKKAEAWSGKQLAPGLVVSR